jgi:hypothetical protein
MFVVIGLLSILTEQGCGKLPSFYSITWFMHDGILCFCLLLEDRDESDQKTPTMLTHVRHLNTSQFSSISLGKLADFSCALIKFVYLVARDSSVWIPL